MTEPESRFDDGFEYRLERELTRICRWPGNKRWHLETKLDCYGTKWETAPGSGSENFWTVAAQQNTIEIMLWEQRERLTKQRMEVGA